MGEHLNIGIDDLSIDEVVAVAVDRRKVQLHEKAVALVEESRHSIERIVASGKPVYGVTTGVGRLASVRLAQDQRGLMQKNLLESHASGTGPLLPREVVRAAMLLRAVSLSHGYSGIRLETLRMLIDLLNADIVPRFGWLQRRSRASGAHRIGSDGYRYLRLSGTSHAYRAGSQALWLQPVGFGGKGRSGADKRYASDDRDYDAGSAPGTSNRSSR